MSDTITINAIAEDESFYKDIYGNSERFIQLDEHRPTPGHITAIVFFNGYVVENYAMASAKEGYVETFLIRRLPPDMTRQGYFLAFRDDAKRAILTSQVKGKVVIIAKDDKGRPMLKKKKRKKNVKKYTKKN